LRGGPALRAQAARSPAAGAADSTARDAAHLWLALRRDAMLVILGTDMRCLENAKFLIV
jgi:hypothetical protein